MDWDISTVVAVASAGLAVISALVSWRNAARLATLQYDALKAGLDADVVSWSSEALDVLSRASGLARSRSIYDPASFEIKLTEVSCQLSALADRGRLFFPNEEHDKIGTDREQAFKGIRPPILDALVFACCQIEQMRTDGGGDLIASEFLTNCRRLLVSEAQNAVNPRRRKEMLALLAVGRKDDEVSAFDAAHDLAASLDKRFPGLPAVVAFFKTYKPQRATASAPHRRYLKRSELGSCGRCP